MIKSKEVSDFSSLKQYVKQQNCLFSIFILIAIIISFILIIMSLKWSRYLVVIVSLGLSIIGTFFLGLTTVYSSKEIIQMSAMHINFDIDKAKSILSTKLLSGIGTVFLLCGIILQSINNLP